MANNKIQQTAKKRRSADLRRYACISVRIILDA